MGAAPSPSGDRRLSSYFGSDRIGRREAGYCGRRRPRNSSRGSAHELSSRSLRLRCSSCCICRAAAAEDLKIALVYGLTGPLQAYAKQTETGLKLGFEYATKGTMEV